MSDFDSADEEFNEFSLPPIVSDIAVPAPLKFRPWHKPRKQFVRQRQWIHHARGTISWLKNTGVISQSDAVSYLTLPGPDMLDVRMMAEACSAEGVALKYTGFCSVGEEEATRLRRNASQFQIDLQGAIQKGSEVHASRLEDVVRNGSNAKTMLERGGHTSSLTLMHANRW